MSPRNVNHPISSYSEAAQRRSGLQAMTASATNNQYVPSLLSQSCTGCPPRHIPQARPCSIAPAYISLLSRNNQLNSVDMVPPTFPCINAALWGQPLTQVNAAPPVQGAH
jgi:hypothetical protein